jgi:hypothetical protein
MAAESAESPPYPNPHSPDERRLYSNVGHWVEGGVLGVTSGLSLLDAVRPELGWPARWSARSATAAGMLLGGGILVGTLHHGGPRLYLRHEHQDREHLRMAALIATGGLVEASVSAHPARLGGAAPLAGVGSMFLTHEQHGTGEALEKSKAAHRRLGLSLVAAGAAKAADALRLPGPWALVWPSLGLAVAAQLLGYREPAGAYEQG